MNGSSLASRTFEDGDLGFSQHFLTTHRAQSACSCELARLSTELVKSVKGLQATGVADTPVVRQSPERCIVQLGPVALTVAWLKGTLDTVAEGELLVVVWKGAVAPQSEHRPEQAARRRAPATATALWEEVLVAHAENESSWGWRSRSAEGEAFSTVELAAHCVARLQHAHGLIEPIQ